MATIEDLAVVERDRLSTTILLDVVDELEELGFLHRLERI
jgi:hypothetical protein